MKKPLPIMITCVVIVAGLLFALYKNDMWHAGEAADNATGKILDSISTKNVLTIVEDTVLRGKCELLGGIIIEQGCKLTIEAGSEIKLGGPKGFIWNEGFLFVNGTKAAPVLFDRFSGVACDSGPNEGGPTVTDRYRGSSVVKISYADLLLDGGPYKTPPPIDPSIFDLDREARRPSRWFIDAATIELDNVILSFSSASMPPRIARGKSVKMSQCIYKHSGRQTYYSYQSHVIKRAGQPFHDPLIFAWDCQIDRCEFYYAEPSVFRGGRLRCTNSLFKNYNSSGYGSLAYSSDAQFDDCMFEQSTIYNTDALLNYCWFSNCNIITMNNIRDYSCLSHFSICIFYGCWMEEKEIPFYNVGIEHKKFIKQVGEQYYASRKGTSFANCAFEKCTTECSLNVEFCIFKNHKGNLDLRFDGIYAFIKPYDDWSIFGISVDESQKDKILLRCAQVYELWLRRKNIRKEAYPFNSTDIVNVCQCPPYAIIPIFGTY